MNAIEEMEVEALREENRELKEQVAEYHRLKVALPHIIQEAVERAEEER